jgi:hypothetical protein
MWGPAVVFLNESIVAKFVHISVTVWKLNPLKKIEKALWDCT